MTILAPPPAVSQKVGVAGDWEWCGLANVACAADAFGKPTPVIDVDSWMVANGINPNNGTISSWLTSYARAHGIPCHAVPSGDRNSIISALSRGHMITWLIRSNGLGDPWSPTTTHWVMFWGWDGTSWSVMNPLGTPTFGQNHQYSDNILGPQILTEGIEWDFTYGAGMAGTVDPTMLLRGSVQPWYRIFTGLWAAKSDMDWQVANATDSVGNAEWGLEGWFGNPNFTACLDRLGAVARGAVPLGPGPQGPAGPPGPPGPAGSATVDVTDANFQAAVAAAVKAELQRMIGAG